MSYNLKIDTTEVQGTNFRPLRPKESGEVLEAVIEDDDFLENREQALLHRLMRRVLVGVVFPILDILELGD